MELIGAVLFVIVALTIGYVVLRLSGILISGKDYDSTMKNFDLLNRNVEELLEEKNYASTRLIYYLGNKFVLVGYNYKDPSVQMKTCSGIFQKSEAFEEARKQVAGLCDGACLCIYKNTNLHDFDQDVQLPLKCKSFDENLVFLASADQDIFCSIDTGWQPSANSEYYQQERRNKFLVLYGFNTKEIYIDKYKALDGNIFLYFAQYRDAADDPVYRRSVFMQQHYENN